MSIARFAFCALFVAAGIVTLAISILGTYRFRYALNRMHSASVGDTLGLFLICIGLMIAWGVDWASAKLVLVIIFMWAASPVASHLIAQLECRTDAELLEHMEMQDWRDNKR